MSAKLRPLVQTLSRPGPLDVEALEAAFAIVMDGGAEPDELAAFLQSTIAFMDDPAALAAGARALRARMAPVDLGQGLIDVCGTGGDGSHSLNISTAAALVLAGAGLRVAKHGNRAMSSKAGGADTFEALGVNLNAPAPLIARAVREAGVGFLFAQNRHPAMAHVAAARRALGRRTIFNLLGPLSNPADAQFQLIGVFDERWLTPMAEARGQLGASRFWIVHGHGGLDELSPAGESRAIVWADGAFEHRTVSPADAGLATHSLAAIKGGDAQYNAAALRRLLAGETGAYRDTVVLNAAAGLMVAERARDLREGAAIAAEAIDRGGAQRALEKLVAITNGQS